MAKRPALTSVRAFPGLEDATNGCFPANRLPSTRLGRAYFVLCKPERLCYTAPARSPRRVRLFLCSSAVEHSTVNRMVAGSNPARGARKINRLYLLRFGSLDAR